MERCKNQKGFTLIELLVVVAIIGILSAVGVVAYNGYTKASKRAAAEANFDMVFKYAMHETAKCTMLELEIAFNDFFGCNSFNGSNITNSRKMLLVAHSTCVALGGLTYRGRSYSSETVKNPYAPNEPACGKDSNFHGQFDRQGRKYTARSDSYIETKSIFVTSNSDRSMFAVKCPSSGKDNMLGMIVFMTGENNCPVVKQIVELDAQYKFGAISLASCVASPCLDPNNIVVRDFSFD